MKCIELNVRKSRAEILLSEEIEAIDAVRKLARRESDWLLRITDLVNFELMPLVWICRVRKNNWLTVCRAPSFFPYLQSINLKIVARDADMYGAPVRHWALRDRPTGHAANEREQAIHSCAI